MSYGETAPEAHDWFVPDFIGYECCRKCGVVRRADDKNKPCRGAVRVEMRSPTPMTPESVAREIAPDIWRAAVALVDRLGEPFTGAPEEPNWVLNVIAAALAAERDRERERCARVVEADKGAGQWPDGTADSRLMALRIATAIRTPPEGEAT